MNLKIKMPTVKLIEYKNLREFDKRGINIGVRDDKYFTIELDQLDEDQLNRLQKVLEKHAKDPKVVPVLRDFKLYLNIDKLCGSAKSTTVSQFCDLLTAALLNLPGHRIYERDKNTGMWSAYFVQSVRYDDGESFRQKSQPTTEVKLVYREFGMDCTTSITFDSKECCYMTISEALNKAGYYLETPELRKEYLEFKSKFEVIAEDIGAPYLADGYGCTLDNWRHSYIPFAMEGQKSKVILDVFFEVPPTKEPKKYQIDFWWNKKTKSEQVEPSREYRDSIEIPTHFNVIVFDLARSDRFKTHINNLTKYKFDSKASKRLVLPAEQRKLIDLLISKDTNAFKDIVSGKSGGTVMALCGDAGLGKTLTCEVVAESVQRVLYSVQCSQLGVEPEDLEKNLRLVFDRAHRWNAIILLDEADVYVQKRGDSLNLNAIVGVFLRLLEYHSGIMFLTTNRASDIDDAVLSRCVARIDYRMPQAQERHDIWMSLIGSNKLTISPDDLAKLVELSDGMSGRDIKNVLRLALLFNPKLTPESVEYVKQFKPTITKRTNKDRLHV